MAAKKVTVIRDGKEKEMCPENLVVGDLVSFHREDKVPADIRIISATCDLMVDCKTLTGESDAQPRSERKTQDHPLITANLLFLGTFIVKGAGRGIVHKTGKKTMIGQIAKLTSGPKPKSTLEEEIDHFVEFIATIALVIAFLMTCLRRLLEPELTISEALWHFVTIIVANIPEGLLPTLVASLNISAKRMARKKVLIKKFDAVETLGNVSVLCSDKTGTITTGIMKVSHINTMGTTYDAEEN